jgi:glutathione synthase/RimK-type ligase-like ATP-grasp enzyme
VHPDLAAAAAAAQTVGLDICGIDVVCDTILKPLEDQGGGIVEVNAAPACACTSTLPSARAAMWARPLST